MGLKRVSIFVFSAVFVACTGPALADQYRAEEFLSLDLSQAVLSPKRLGPPAEFAPVAVEARSDAAQTPEEPSVDYRAGVVREYRLKEADGDLSLDAARYALRQNISRGGGRHCRRLGVGG